MNIMKTIDLNKILNSKEEVRNTTLEKILKQIKQADSIAIVTHESPDGDAVGSSLALYQVIKNHGKNVEVYIPEYSRLFKFLPYSDEIKNKLKDEPYDLVIAVDSAEQRRIEGKKHFENAKNTIVIDHHSTNTMFGDINYVNPVSPACAQVLISMLQYYNIEITKEIGTCIITGIITDTGGFRYRGVSVETFEYAAELLQKGVDISKIYQQVQDTQTKANFELSKKVMDRMEFLEDGKISFSYINEQDEIDCNAEPGDTEGLVEIGRDIEDVQVAIFVREKKEDGGYKISLRSIENINVADICYSFGGGGHLNAAGCFIKGSLYEVKNKIIKEIRKIII